MKSTNNPQINTRTYWNHIYTMPTTKDGYYWAKTNRFFKATELVKDGDRFLDVGCGIGVLCHLVKEKKKGCEIWGTDISDEAIKYNLEKDPDIHYKQGRAGYQDFLPGSYFDVVFAGEILEHLDDPSLLFKEANRILKPTGKLIVTTPIENHVDSPEHVWYFTKDDVESMFLNNGFKKVQFLKLPDAESVYVFFSVGTK